MADEVKNDSGVKPEEEEVVLCHRCGRVLKGERSRKLGYGPSCYAMWQKERSQQIQLFDIDKGDST